MSSKKNPYAPIDWDQPIYERLKNLRQYYTRLYGRDAALNTSMPQKSQFGLPETSDEEIRRIIESERHPPQNIFQKMFTSGEKHSPTADKYEQYLVAKNIYEMNQEINKVSFWDRLDGDAFEQAVAFVYEQMGYQAEVSKKGKDGGIDIILTKGYRRTVVQCKAQSKAQGPSIARDLYGVKEAGNFDEAILVSKNGFTKDCKEFAKGKVELVDLEKLLEYMPNVSRIDISEYKEEQRKKEEEKAWARPQTPNVGTREKNVRKIEKEQTKRKKEQAKQQEEIEKIRKIQAYIAQKTANGGSNSQVQQGHKVVQLKITGEYIAEYDSVSEAAKVNETSPKSIRDCISGTQKTAAGFKWVDYDKYYKKSAPTPSKPSIGSRKAPQKQNSKQNEKEIKPIPKSNPEWTKWQEIVRYGGKYGLGMKITYCSIKSAAEDNNVPPEEIQACLDGKQATAGGFSWKREY